MARKPRLFVPGATYHVYCRVARGEFVFDDPIEAEGFVEKVQEIRDQDDWRILAWCLMGNHYHLVVKTSLIPLWRSMLRLQAGIARAFNRRHRYLGRLWQSRYRARIIDSPEYFKQVVPYVHLNPVMAGAVSDPVEYANCGHREIVGYRPTRLVNRTSVLAEFNESNGLSAQENYGSWIRNVAEAKWADQCVGELPWWKTANDQDEIATTDSHPEAETFKGQSLLDERVTCDIESFLGFFERMAGHSIENLASPLKTRSIVDGRVELTILGVSRFGLSSSDIAALIDKDPSSMTRWLNQGILRERNEPEFRERIDLLDRRISEAVRNNE